MRLRTDNSFVLFPLGERRFALPAENVTELARPDRLQTFPHTTPMLAGVLVRRGRIVPVCDVAPILIGPNAPARKFYLIANRRFTDGSEWTAIPVTGECELASATMTAAASDSPTYVRGEVAVAGNTVHVVDLELLIAMGNAEVHA